MCALFAAIGRSYQKMLICNIFIAQPQETGAIIRSFPGAALKIPAMIVLKFLYEIASSRMLLATTILLRHCESFLFTQDKLRATISIWRRKIIIMGASKNSPYELFLSFPRKRESIKIKQLDSPIKSGNDKKRNNERFA